MERIGVDKGPPDGDKTVYVEKFYCWQCGKVEIPEPVGCCSGQDCGCMGFPIDPPFCSEECQKEYFTQHIPVNIESRRINHE